ncbi:MAG: cation-translocating P-type ATPase [Microthrixaceae bacterium]
MTNDIGAPWTVDPQRVADALATDLSSGLTTDEATRRWEARGPNALVEQAQPGRWQIFARQFANTMTVVLALAGLVTVVVGDVKDTIVIGVIVVLNAVVGFVQEYRAEQAMAALKQLTIGTARLVRDGQLVDVPTPQLVRGDLVELTAGDVIPADLRLVDVRSLRVDEAALTGESEPTAKTADTLRASDAVMIADRHNMAFKGTAVTFGRARGVVVATGMGTELGKIAAMLQTHVAEPTPLQRSLAVLGRRMAAAALVICAVVFAAGVARGEPAETMLLTSVSLAVAAIPEGLPAIVTVALALGARRMAERHAVIRRLPAVETLGSVTVICADKTGTLTENRMMVEHVWTPVGGYAVTGAGYAPAGDLTGGEDHVADPYLARLAGVAAACNDATLHPPDGANPEWTITGDPTEGALAALAAKLGVERVDLERRCPRAAEIAFDADRRRMTTVHHRDGAWWVAVKGALGALTPRLDPADLELAAVADRAADALADRGYRVLALAERHAVTPLEPLDDLEQGLRLLGLVAIADPPRTEVADAVASCRAAGITPVMITGDHPRTARAIAQRLGLLDDDSAEIVTGHDLDGLDDDALLARIADVRVFARTNPEQKLRIVDAWKAKGAVVAMTGDGVNDAPALRRADIGVAMGTIGTDVSKEAADMVLADDNFATIVHAVEEGRRIYDSIRRFVRYLLTTNSGELWVMFLAPFLGMPLPLLPAQILWINLVTDGLPAVALGLEPAEPDTMQRRPRSPRESIVGRGLWQHAVWVGLLMAAVVLPLQAVTRAADWPWQTMVFTTLALLQLGHALAVRSERESLFRLGHRSNPWIGRAVAASAAAQLATVYVPAFHAPFGTEALTLPQLGVVLVLSTTACAAVEIEKAIRRRSIPTGAVAP